jgi:hypothetical protein
MGKAKDRKLAGPPANRESISLSIRQVVSDYLYRIDTDADYQREKVWSRSDQELLLDSVAKNIDIPKLYLARVHGNKQFEYECIDGKQRLLTLSEFYKPEDDASPLRIEILNKKYTYGELAETLPSIAKSVDDYKLDFVVYDEASLSESFIREIFRRLQLGIRLNSGELLNSHLGTIRDFVFKDIGKDGPFLKYTKLSDKRYSRQFALAQMCINSFSRSKSGEFVRARLSDLEEFFLESSNLSSGDDNLKRIRKVLDAMDEAFKDKAQVISSRAVAVSAFLFAENLVSTKQSSLIKSFAIFLGELLHVIENDMELISKYKEPTNKTVLEDFQKYVLQASVEPYAIKRRDDFLEKAFAYYRRPKSKGTIIGR